MPCCSYATTGARSAARRGRAGPLATLRAVSTVLWRNPRVGVGCVRPGHQHGLAVRLLRFMPTASPRTSASPRAEWLHLLARCSATNIFANLLFGVVGDRFGWRRPSAGSAAPAAPSRTLLLYYVPNAVGANYWLALVVGRSTTGLRWPDMYRFRLWCRRWRRDTRGGAGRLNLGRGRRRLRRPRHRRGLPRPARRGRCGVHLRGSLCRRGAADAVSEAARRRGGRCRRNPRRLW